MFWVAGAIAEELVTGVGYGEDGHHKSDYEKAWAYASRGDEYSEEKTRSILKRLWGETEHKLRSEWSCVVAVAHALLDRGLLTGTEVVAILLDTGSVPCWDPPPIGRGW